MEKNSSLAKLISAYSGKSLDVLLSNKIIRKQIMGYLDKKIHADTLGNKKFPKKVQEDKYFMVRSMMLAVERALTGAKKSPNVRKALINFLVNSTFFKENEEFKKFQKKFDTNPPGFLAISPGKFCNLKCIGCYANSSSLSADKLDWDIFDRIVKEKTKLWGSHFTVISGGEPFLYESQDKTLLDIAKNNQNNYFLVFTNGTLIDKKMAKDIAEIGNIAPAISVEGFENETDQRRGKGIHKKVIAAMKNLREAGVPFGISVTATKENADIVVSDEFVDYYFGELGATFGWFFQLMPIGRADCLSLMVTPEQRVKMFRRTQSFVRDRKIFIADFWNSGCTTSGCISAGREGGYLYIEWNGNVTPCVFNPYSPVNINEIYKSGRTLNDVLSEPFFEDIRKWQKEYALDRKPGEMGNLVVPCAIKDHFDSMHKILEKHKPKPIDDTAAKALEDEGYKEGLKKYGEDVMKATKEIWKKEYLES